MQKVYSETLADDRKNGAIVSDTISTWTLPETLTGIAVVISIYLILVTRILPAYMKNKEPYKLYKILQIYNIFQVALSFYTMFLYTRYMFRHFNGLITTRCAKGKDLQDIVDEIYPYFYAKHIDLLDTVFFVLRKKENQITFLHLFHHAVMISWTWLHLMYHPTDHFVIGGLMNSFVHVLMYFYYWISSLGPEYAKFIWWKKHLTKVQLLQFIIAMPNFYYQQKLTPCPIPAFFHYFCVILNGSFFFLFLNFYFRAYKARNKKEQEVAKKN